MDSLTTIGKYTVHANMAGFNQTANQNKLIQLNSLPAVNSVSLIDLMQFV